MTAQPHRHARLTEDLLTSIERPPEVRTEQVVVVTFRRGEGCCASDTVRECVAYFSLAGDLLAVIDPAPRTPEWPGPRCGNDGCPCATPGTVCEQFQDDGSTRRCARCGWWRSTHGEGASGG